ncbi:MAG: hypothetical protein IJI19_03605, partial [Ruminococcus sp.]|nr:hypothetical protein [Ruminococcus sp.]
MNKRILSILLCLMLVASLLVLAVPVSAENFVDVKVTADKTTAKPGDTVVLTVSIGPIEALSTFDMKVKYPDGLTPVSGEKNPAMTEAVGEGQYAVNAAKGAINGFTDSGNYSSNEDTVLATITCTVDEDATGTLTVDFVDEKFWFTTEENTDDTIPYSYNTVDITITSAT